MFADLFMQIFGAMIVCFSDVCSSVNYLFRVPFCLFVDLLFVEHCQITRLDVIDGKQIFQINIHLLEN